MRENQIDTSLMFICVNLVVLHLINTKRLTTSLFRFVREYELIRVRFEGVRIIRCKIGMISNTLG